MLEELNGIQVLVSAVLVGQPLAFLLAVIQIEHGRDRVDTDAVDVVLVDPVHDVGDQEVADLGFAQVKDLGAPVGVLAAAGIRIFKDAAAVESGKAVGIRTEVGGNPVKDNTDACLMQGIDQVHEILGLAVSGGRRIVACDLIAPGAVKRMLGNTHQLYVGKRNVLEVFDQSVRKLSVVIEAVRGSVGMFHPGTDMALIDGQLGLVGILFGAVLHPA